MGKCSLVKETSETEVGGRLDWSSAADLEQLVEAGLAKKTEICLGLTLN